jgi:hypothetical protein
MVIKMVINWVMIHMELMNQWMEWELYPIFRHTDILSGFRRSSLKNFRRRKAIPVESPQNHVAMSCVITNHTMALWLHTRPSQEIRDPEATEFNQNSPRKWTMLYTTLLGPLPIETVVSLPPVLAPSGTVSLQDFKTTPTWEMMRSCIRRSKYQNTNHVQHEYSLSSAIFCAWWCIYSQRCVSLDLFSNTIWHLEPLGLGMTWPYQTRTQRPYNNQLRFLHPPRPWHAESEALRRLQSSSERLEMGEGYSKPRSVSNGRIVRAGTS